MGAKQTGTYFTLHLLPTAQQESKLGISAPKQFGNAVDRNKFKRRVREIFRMSKEKHNHVIHVKPRPYAKTATFWQLQQEFISLIQKSL